MTGFPHHLPSVRTAVVAAAAFVLGACAATAVQSVADSSPAARSAATPSAAATVIGLDAAEKREVGGGKAAVRLLAQGRNAFVGRLELAAGGKVPEHRDATEEFIHVLQGNGAMWIDDREYAVKTGTTVYMPAGAKVRFSNGPARLVALQVFAGPAPAAKYDKWQRAGGTAAADNGAKK